MFFIMGMSQGQKELEFSQTMVCDICGKYGRYEVFMTYMYLSFFFIPLFKWNRQYFVRTSCCQSVYELDPEKGRAIEAGERVTIRSSDLILQYRGDAAAQGGAYGSGDSWGSGNGSGSRDAWGSGNGSGAASSAKGSEVAAKVQEGPFIPIEDKSRKICPACGYSADPDFEYCPKCGKKLEQ